MNKTWYFSLNSYIVEDLAVSDFYTGQVVDFSISFGVRGLYPISCTGKEVSHIKLNKYYICADTICSGSDFWVIDFGLYAYFSSHHLPVISHFREKHVCGQTSLFINPWNIDVSNGVSGGLQIMYTWRIESIDVYSDCYGELSQVIERTHVLDSKRRLSCEDSGMYLLTCVLLSDNYHFV